MNKKIYLSDNEEKNRVELSKLNEILLQAGNGQSFDLIWGPALDFVYDDDIVHINLDNTINKESIEDAPK